jgi:hypothetical protein
MTNKEANSALGLASRKLAFALVEEISGKNWTDRDINKLQEALYYYGKEIANKCLRTL